MLLNERNQIQLTDTVNSYFPNFPFENGIVLTTGNVNSAGNVTNTSALNEGNNTIKTNLSDLDQGLYILKLYNDFNQELIKVVKDLALNRCASSP